MPKARMSTQITGAKPVGSITNGSSGKGPQITVERAEICLNCPYPECKNGRCKLVRGLEKEKKIKLGFKMGG